MRKLYYSACSVAAPHIGVIINSIKNDLSNGHEVILAHCSGVCTSCYKNENANSSICKLCRIVYKHCIYKQIPNVKIVGIPSVKKKNSSSFAYKTISELKNVTYKETFIGLSVLSFYFSTTRNIEFAINNELKSYFDYILNDCTALVDEIEEIIKKEHPDCLTIYNGRFYENRAIYDLANKHNLKFEALEVVGGYQEPFYPVTFTDCLPQDYHYRAKKALQAWEESKLSEQEKIEFASSFYEKRRKGIEICDKAYTKNQITGKLPKLVEGKRNIVIFNSSPDEIAALGGEWESEQLFDSQYEAIRFLLASIDNNFHVYLRIHPNLKSVTHRHHMDLYKLSEDFNNITIIPPSDDVSSYALLDIADKVVVFGSTMGAEACYWGKVVILVGPSFYADLDVAYRPTTPKDFIELVKADLPIKDKKNALYYAYYILDREVLPDKMNFNITPMWHSFLGFKYRTCDYLTIHGSKTLFKLAEIFYREMLRLFTPDKNKVVV